MPDQNDSFRVTRHGGHDGIRAFTLLEMVVVIALVVSLSLLFMRGLSGGKSSALKSAQAILANLIVAARTHALANGRPCRILVHIDPASTVEPHRYLRFVVTQLQDPDGDWRTIAANWLPDSVYIVPGNSTSLPTGLFADSPTVPWKKVDNTDLRSTALRFAQGTTLAIEGATAERWVALDFSANGTTFQSGDLIFVHGRPRAPGTRAAGEAPVVLENPADVRGLTLSTYGVPALVNGRTSF